MQLIKFTNNKTINGFLNIIIFLIILGLVVLPYLFYIRKFYYGKDSLSLILSNEQGIWGTFGDFIGGTTNTILNIIVLLITVRISLKVHEESKNLQEQQVRPFPLFVHSEDNESYTFKLYNGGLGPLIVNRIKYIKFDMEVENLHELIGGICLKHNIMFIAPTFSHLVIAPNAERNLFEIPNRGTNFSKCLSEIYEELREIKTELDFTDIFYTKYQVFQINTLN